MFKTASGVSIPFPEKITEGFKRYETGFRCVISFEKLPPFFTEFYLGLDEPLFLILQVPFSQQEEIRHNEPDHLHEKVMYLDGCSKDRIGMIMQAFGELLFNDGMSKFGIAAHVSGDEMFIDKYKIVSVFSKDLDKHVPLMSKYGIYETDSLITPWDTFSRENPGESRRIKVNGRDIYYVTEKLIEMGMYTGKIVKAY
jgi:hypothetical protein